MEQILGCVLNFFPPVGASGNQTNLEVNGLKEEKKRGHWLGPDYQGAKLLKVDSKATESPASWGESL